MKRLPYPPLRPFVASLWIAKRPAGPARIIREHALPTGAAHLVIRLTSAPIRLHVGAASCSFGHAVIGGARSEYHVKEYESGSESISIGAELLPGATRALFGASADELAERHTRLGDLWGRQAELARDEILEAGRRGGHEGQMLAFEAILLRRLPRVHAMNPAVAFAIEQLRAGRGIQETIRSVGYSHRHFIALFRRASGLSPKTYARILRLQTALHRANASQCWSRVAIDSGYSDQSHFCREFSSLTGITPSQYRRIAPSQTHHVPVQVARR